LLPIQSTNFAASVYGAKATRSTFKKVDRVEFNLVAPPRENDL